MEPAPRDQMPFRTTRRRGATTIPTSRSFRPALTLTLTLALASLALPGQGRAQDAGIALGTTPEPVVLETLDGDPVDLSRLTGETPVLIEFWATWCAVCRALEPALSAAHEEYGDQVEFVVVAAAVGQTPQSVQRHLARHPAPGRVLWDTRGRFTRAFDPPGTGYIVILDREGRVAYTGTGVDQDLPSELRRVIATK